MIPTKISFTTARACIAIGQANPPPNIAMPFCPVPHTSRDQIWLSLGLAAGCAAGYFFNARNNTTTTTAAASTSNNTTTQGSDGSTIYEVNCHVDNSVVDEFKSWLVPHYKEILKLQGFQSAEMFQVEREVDTTPNVLFVLGGPGAGKGTQCGNIVANYDYEHISAGDCLREERNNPNSENGALINDYIKRGAIVPVAITVALLLKKMQKSPKTKFLIDGFPRNADNLQGWYDVVGDKANVLGVLFFDCAEETMTARLLGRADKAEKAGQARRKDDNLESIKKRFRTYQTATRPIIQTYATMGKCMTVDANAGSIDAIFAAVKPIIEAIDAKLVQTPQTTLTNIYRVDTRAQLEDYFVNHAARLRGDGLKAFAGKFTADRRVMKSIAKV